MLIGFNYNTYFQQGFDSLPASAHVTGPLGQVLLLLSFAGLVSTICFHWIVEHGNATQQVLRYATQAIELSLGPFVLGLGLGIYTSLAGSLSTVVAAAAGSGASIAAFVFWYGIEYAMREPTADRGGDPMEQTTIKDKVEHSLTETRMVLPGAQALLGFQLLTPLTKAWETLPEPVRYAHMSSLLLVAASTILLIAPASFHRIVERGEYTDRVVQFASRMILSAMALIGAGMAGDLFVILWKITSSLAIAVAGGVTALACAYLLWFGYSLYCRAATG